MNFGKFHRISKVLRSHVKSGRILDAGCGIGSFPLILKELGFKVDTIDMTVDPEMTWFAENNISRAAVDLQTGEIPHEDGAFSAITCLDVIEHLHGSPSGMLAEFRRVLAPGGYAFIETPNAVHIANRVKVMAGKSPADDINYYYNAPYPYTNHIREYTVPELKKVMEWSGFQVVGVHCYNSFLDYSRTDATSESSDATTASYRHQYDVGFKFRRPADLARLMVAGITAAWPKLRQSQLIIGRKPVSE